MLNALSTLFTLTFVVVPLAIGLLVKARWDEAAEGLVHPITQISNISLALLLVLMLGLNISKVLALFGSSAIVSLLVLIGAAAGGGYLLGGPGGDTRRVLALDTGQRNMAASFTIAASNFADRPDILVLLAAAGLVGMIVVMPLASEYGKHVSAAPVPTPSGATSAA